MAHFHPSNEQFQLENVDSPNSPFHDAGIQVEDGAGGGGGGGEFVGGESGIDACAGGGEEGGGAVRLGELGELFLVEGLENGEFGRGGGLAGEGAPEEGEAGFDGGGLFECELSERARGLEDFGFIQLGKCLQRSVGALASGDADFAFGHVEDFHSDIGHGAFPERVERAAVGVVRIDAGAADGWVEELGGGEELIAHGFGSQADLGTTGEEEIFGILGADTGGNGGVLAVGPGQDDFLDECFDIPAAVEEAAGQVIEEFRVAGQAALEAEIFGSGHKSGAPEALPEAIDDDASREGIAGIGDPFGKAEAVAGPDGIEWEDGGWDIGGDGIALGFVTAAF